MVRKISFNDLEKIYTLGCEYDVNFKRLYDLNQYIDNLLYILECYEDNGTIKGFIIANKLYETVEILLIYVKDEYRRCGIASKLLCCLEQSDVENLLLEVSIENESAKNLYKKLGFEVINIRKGYYNGVDALVMKKVLK